MKKRIGEHFWNSKAATEVFQADSSEESSLHVYLAEIIRASDPSTLLDFGCGDGAFLSSLDPSIEIGLYDINLDAANNAGRNSKANKTEIYADPETIKPSHYDIAVFSFVLICLSNEREFRTALGHVRDALKTGGKLIIAEAHPCFRDKIFAGHRVDYTDEEPFNYNARFHEFPICLLGESDREVRFHDYHWTLSDLINTIVASGFTIEKIQEIPDTPFAGRLANEHFPPFLITSATKSPIKT